MKSPSSNPKIKRQRQVIIGGGLILISFLLFISFVSYLTNWKEDYSSLNSFFDRSVEVQNILSKTGLFISHLFIYHGVGLASFIIIFCLLLVDSNYFLTKKTMPWLLNGLGESYTQSGSQSLQVILSHRSLYIQE